MPSNAVTLDQRDKIARGITRECGTTKVRVIGKIVRGTGVEIGKVAATAAGDANLFAELVIVLDQEDASAALSSHRRAHHAGGTSADDDDVERGDVFCRAPRGGRHVR